MQYVTNGSIRNIYGDEYVKKKGHMDTMQCDSARKGKGNNAIFRDIHKLGISKLCRDQKEKNTIIIGYVISLAGRKENDIPMN